MKKVESIATTMTSSQSDSRRFGLVRKKSKVFEENKRTKESSDISLVFYLLHHEVIRRQIAALQKGTTALETQYDDRKDDWRILCFAGWYNDYFYPAIDCYIRRDKEIISWIAARSGLEQHKYESKNDLSHTQMDNVFRDIAIRRGKNCTYLIGHLKELVPKFIRIMNLHFVDREQAFPQLFQRFTEDEKEQLVRKVILRWTGDEQKSFRALVPPILEAMEDFESPELVKYFSDRIPLRLQLLTKVLYMNDYKKRACAMRDAPTIKVDQRLSFKGQMSTHMGKRKFTINL